MSAAQVDNSDSESDENASKEMPFLAPLNDCNSIVCGPSKFGPVTVSSCIMDSGCTSLLLPWPEDPDVVLAPLLVDPCLKCATSLAGSVGSDHVTFHVRAASPIFEVVLDKRKVGVFVSELRFVITEDARQWLQSKTPSLWRKKFVDSHVHNCNLEYALVGQSVLTQLLYMNVYEKGFLFLRSPMNKRPVTETVAELLSLANELYNFEISSPHYEKLKDLRERYADPQLSLSPLKLTHCNRADLSSSNGRSLGRRMDTFGIGKLTCHSN
jgi:hypothetical protein